MRNLQNLHTHTLYCDGKNTPEEMILAAIAKGFVGLGFSEHTTTPSPATPNEEQLSAYRREVRALAEKYKGQIDVFCGLEYDPETSAPLHEYDYLIASMHYVHKNGGRYTTDGAPERVRRGIDEAFGGDGMAFALTYFKELCSLADGGHFDIIGHFDLVSKHCEKVGFFDPCAPEYIKAGLTVIDALVGKIPFFEVNTGAIARGNRTTPYPAPVFLRAFREHCFGAVITSDCHDAAFLDCHFREAAALLESCGFTERYILTKRGFEAVPLY